MDGDAARALVRAPGGDRPARLALLLVLARARGHEPRHLGGRRRAAARDARPDRRPGLRLGGRGRGVPARGRSSARCSGTCSTACRRAPASRPASCSPPPPGRSWSRPGTPGTIVALALVCGVTTGIFKIVSTAVVPMLVDDEDLDAANGAILSAQTLTNVAGVALGGALVGLTSTQRRAAAERRDLRDLGRRPARLQPRSRARAAVARRQAERQPRLARALRRRRAPLPAHADAAHGRVQPAGGLDRARHRDRGRRADAARHLRRLEPAGRRHHGARRARHRDRHEPAGALRGLPERHRRARDRLGRLRHRARPAGSPGRSRSSAGSATAS